MPETSPPAPTSLQRLDERRLRIEWSDGEVRVYSARELREVCPCATCREKRSAPAPPPTQLAVIKPEEAKPIDIAGMQPAGAYAYNVSFTDGHSSGLFTFDLLRSLGQPVGADG
ncbi:MAG: DUF971 domain-containing protein [Planctomycetota bacterium]